MNRSKTDSWIFLALALASRAEPANYEAISSMADGINHAIPTQQEMQLALKWLISVGLVSKQSHRYALTESGLALLERTHSDDHTMWSSWRNLEAEFSTLQR